ncbi:flagellin [Gemmatimonadetes bacterium T265]|nr:flagellin [Gemmatimonadetes bacterium T265]
MKIQTNTSAMFALNYMSVNEKNSQKSIQRLSSGFRINQAGDDAAGLAIANKLRSDSKGLGQAQKNVAQASSMLQVMDGATQTVSSILDRMKELATQANSANIGNQSGQLQKEFTQLSSEIDRIAATTNYQGTKLLDGTFGAGVDMTSSSTSAAYKTGGALAGALSLPGGVSSMPAGAAGIKISYAAGTAAVTTGTPAAATNGTITFQYVDATGANLTGTGNSTTATVTAAASGSTLGAAQTVTSADGKISLALPSTFDFTTTTVLGSSGTPTTVGFQKTGSFQVSSSGSYAFGGNDQIQVNAVDVSSKGLGLSGLDLTTQTGAAAALTALDTAVNTVSTSLGSIGAAESRLDFASTNVATALQNTQAAESTIRDTDMAAEMTNYTKNNILQQAAQSMLSQANQNTQGILKLLQ